jgi:Protein of unknown function (DUF3592)
MFSFLPSRRVLAWFLISLSSVSLIICAVSYFYAQYVARTYTRVQGHVVEVQPHSVGHEEAAYFVVFSFTDDKGREHTVRSRVGSSPAQEKVGDVIPILFLPDQPDSARIGTHDYVWGLTIASAVPGVVVLPVGLLILFWPTLVGRFKKVTVYAA